MSIGGAGHSLAGRKHVLAAGGSDMVSKGEDRVQQRAPVQRANT